MTVRLMSGRELRRVEILLELGRLDDALSCHQRAIELRPNDRRLTILGLTPYQRRQMQASEASYRHTLSLDPDFAKAWF